MSIKTVVIKAFDSDAGIVREFDFSFDLLTLPAEQSRIFDELKHRTVTALGTKWPEKNNEVVGGEDHGAGDDDLSEYRKAELFFNATLGDGVFLLRDEEHVREVLGSMLEGDPIGIVVSLFIEGERQRAVLVKVRNDAMRGVDAHSAEFMFTFCAARPGTFAKLKHACIENMDLLNSFSPSIEPSNNNSSSSSGSSKQQQQQQSLVEVNIEICAPTGEWTRLTCDRDACRCMLDYALDIQLAFVWLRVVRAPLAPRQRAIGVEVMFQGTIAVGTLQYADSYYTQKQRPDVALISSSSSPPRQQNQHEQQQQQQQRRPSAFSARAASPTAPPSPVDDEQEIIPLPEENVWPKLRALCLELHDLPETATVTIMRAVTATEQPTERPISDDASARECIIRARVAVPSVLHLRLEKGVVGTYPSLRRGTVSVNVQVVRDNRKEFLVRKRDEYDAKLQEQGEEGGDRRFNEKKEEEAAEVAKREAAAASSNVDDDDDPLRVHTLSFDYDPERTPTEVDCVSRFRHMVLTRFVDSDLPFTFWVALSDVDTLPFTHPAQAVEEGQRARQRAMVVVAGEDRLDLTGGTGSSVQGDGDGNNLLHDDPVQMQQYLRPTSSLQSALSLSMMAGTDFEIAECLRVAFETGMPVTVKLEENQSEAELFCPSSVAPGGGGDMASVGVQQMWAESQRAATGGWTVSAANNTKKQQQQQQAIDDGFDQLMAGFSQGSFSNRESELRALANEWEDVTGGADNTTEGGGSGGIAGELISIMLSWRPEPRPLTPPSDEEKQQQQKEHSSSSPNKISSGFNNIDNNSKDNNQTSDIVHRGTEDPAYAELVGLLRSLLTSSTTDNTHTTATAASSDVADAVLVESLCDSEKLFAMIRSWTHPLSDTDVSAFTQYCRAAIAAFADVSPQTRLRVLLARAFRAHSANGVVHSSFLRQSILATMEGEVDETELDRLLADYDGSRRRRERLQRGNGEAVVVPESAAAADFVLPRHAFDEIVTYLVKGDAHAVSRLFSYAAGKRPIEIRPSTAEGSTGVAKAREMYLRQKIRHCMDAVTLGMCMSFASECEELAVQATSPPDVWTRVAWAVAALLRNPLAAEDTAADCSGTWKWLRRVLADDTTATDLLFALRTTGWSYAAHESVARAGEVSLATDAEPRRLLPVAPVLSSLSEWCRCVSELTCIVNHWSWPPVTSDAAATGRWGKPISSAAVATTATTTKKNGSPRMSSMHSPLTATTVEQQEQEQEEFDDPHHRGSPPRRAVFRIPVPPAAAADPLLAPTSRRYQSSFTHLSGRGDYSLTREQRPTARQLSAVRRQFAADATSRQEANKGEPVDLQKMLKQQKQDLSAMRERLANNEGLLHAPPTKTEISRIFVSGIFETIEKEESVRSASVLSEHPPTTTVTASANQEEEEEDRLEVEEIERKRAEVSRAADEREQREFDKAAAISAAGDEADAAEKAEAAPAVDPAAAAAADAKEWEEEL